MDKQVRELNGFVHCVCGVMYISGYTHCPKCGVQNPNDTKEKESEVHIMSRTTL